VDQVKAALSFAASLLVRFLCQRIKPLTVWGQVNLLSNCQTLVFAVPSKLGKQRK
jgi:hypothetical protein